jgi:hypothetical protein
MWSTVGAVYLAIAGLSLVPFGFMGLMALGLGSGKPFQVAGLVLLSAATWPVSLGNWIYHKLNGGQA